jgi:hypothetical protein
MNKNKLRSNLHQSNQLINNKVKKTNNKIFKMLKQILIKL